ncbi:MAG: DUF4340 domain-containing protein [Gammaproteobacteria bacterium]
MSTGTLRSRVVLNLFLAAALAGLVLLVIFEPGKKAPDSLPPLSTLKAGAVRKVAITHGAGPRIVLERVAEGWTMREPFTVAANAARMESLLSFVEEQSQGSFPAQGQDLKRYGLAEPAVAAEVDGQRFAFGDLDPLNSRRYVLYQGQVHLIADFGFEYLTGTAASLASLRLLEPGMQPTALALPGRTLEQRDGKWVITPADPTLTSDALTGLVDEWRYANAVSVQPYREGNHQHSIIITLKDGARIAFELMARKPELILARNDLGVQYHFTSDMGRRLLKPKHPKKKAEAKPPAATSDSPGPGR